MRDIYDIESNIVIKRISNAKKRNEKEYLPFKLKIKIKEY